MCFTMGNIGAQTKDGIRDFCFVSPWSYKDRVSIAGGSGNPANVPSLYLHKDAIEGCPDKLPDDSVVEVLGIDMEKRCVTDARIVWIRE